MAQGQPVNVPQPAVLVSVPGVGVGYQLNVPGTSEEKMQAMHQIWFPPPPTTDKYVSSLQGVLPDGSTQGVLNDVAVVGAFPENKGALEHEHGFVAYDHTGQVIYEQGDQRMRLGFAGQYGLDHGQMMEQRGRNYFHPQVITQSQMNRWIHSL